MKAIRNTLALATMTVCLLLALCISAGAEEYSPAIFKTTPFEATQCNTVTTTLYLEENSNLIDFEFQLSYDTDLVALQNAVQSSDLLGDVEITQKEGAVHISYTRTSSNLTKKTNLVELTFLVNENVGPGQYNFLKLDDSYASEAHTMSGDDLYALPIETEFATLDIYDFGDINLSHSVSIADVTTIRQYLAEMRTLSDYQLGLADAYYDKEVSIADAVRMQQYLADHSKLLGNRVNITFMDKDGNLDCVKSVIFGEGLSTIPQLPTYSGYYGGVWSTKAGESIGADFQKIESPMTVYAVYKKDASPAVTFYKERLTDVYYTQNVLNGNLNLVNKLTYQDGYTADIYWSSSNSAVLNASTGQFSQPSYDSTVTLTATIISYADGTIEAQDYIAFEYNAEGKFLCPTKAEIGTYLKTLFTDYIDYNMTLPSKVTNSDLNSSDPFEVRIDWIVRDEKGNEKNVVQLERANTTQNVTLIAVASFNGVPLEDDGRIYFDDITLSSVTQEEVRNYIITQIAAHTGISVTDGEEMWHDDTKYHSTVKWISQNNSIATIDDNVVSIKDVVNGTSLPINVEVTYLSGETPITFKLAYTVSVVTDNKLLVPGTNIDPYLYNALKSATGVYGNLTTDALKNVKFVYLDLSNYPEIEDLTALTYCTNLRVLNISGLQVNETSLNQICTLNKLEALIANHCDITTMTVGGEPVLDKMINLKLLDLAHNNLSSLDSILSKDKRYGQLEELYLNDNQLTDISALCETTQKTTELKNSDGSAATTLTEDVIINRAPMLRFLTLDNNLLTDEDLSAFSNFKVLKYLSLGNNELTSVSPLKDIKTLLELHLQGNEIEDIRDLRFLTHLQSLYLSHNKIRNVFSGATEVNVSYLRYLTDLEILYLNDNDIEDISDFYTLGKLTVLNVNNNRIQDLSVLADKGQTMVELYAENNEVDSFSFVRNLTGLTRLMLSDNHSVYETKLSSYLSNLTHLKTLTLSGKDLRSLEFLSAMTDLVRLDVADCNLPSYCITSFSGDGAITVNGYVDNIAQILSLKDSLKYLDVSNNGLAYGASGIESYLNSTGNHVSVDSIAFSGQSPLTFDTLYEMTNLKVLYADNLKDAVDAQHLFSIMTNINYLSMENCGITDASWLSKFRGLRYVDLSGNNLSEFDLGNYISIRSRGTLNYLYIDSRTDCDFANSYSLFDGNVLKEFSAENVKVDRMDYLPDMESLAYLNLSNSNIRSFIGDNPDFDGWFNLSRYKNVDTLDISGVQADIAEISKLEKLKTLYSVGTVEDTIFLKQNLLELYALDQSGVECYLYGYDEKFEPKTSEEGKLILDTLDDYSCDITVAADGAISDNNPVLPESVNNFDITWTVSNDKNYAVVDNQIAVIDYENIDDEELTLTATISIYPEQGTVSRDFTVNTSILRADLPYLSVNAENISDYMVRGTEFTYDVSCAPAVTEGFTDAVAPVYTDVQYSYSATLSDDSEVPYNTILTVGDGHSYQINADAALGATVVIHADIGHTVNGKFVSDKSIERNIHVAERTFTLTLIANGGTITSQLDGSAVSEKDYIEDSVLFEDICWQKDGYTFTGWYRDEALTEKFEETIMPMSDLTLYAGWSINTYMVTFESNGGSDVESQDVIYGNTASQPDNPTRENYRFMGWYADEALSTAWSFDTPISGDTTIYAKWIYNEYKVTFDANGGTGGTSENILYGSTITAPTVARSGYSLTGWYRDSGCTSAWNLSSDTVTENMTLYAGWQANTYTVTFNGNGGWVGSSSKSVTYASTYGSLPSAGRTGYTFNGWYSLSSGGTRIYDSTKVSTAGNHTLYAQWSIIRVGIPNFSGWYANDAVNWCNNNGISYGLSYAYDYNVGSGYVRSNDYAGATLDYGSYITIYVSSGAKPIAVGDYVYVDAGTKYTADSNGGGTYGWFTNGRWGYVKYMASGRSHPYNIDGYGWVPASSVHQKTN